MSKENVVQIISTAFRNVKIPVEDDYFIPSGNHIFDTALATTELRYDSWQEIPIDSLVDNRNRISYLTPEAFHCLLPALISAIVNHPKHVDTLTHSVVYMLTPPISGDERPIAFEKKAALFSEAQVEAILTFFKNYRLIYPETEWSYGEKDEQQLNRAIEYWTEKLGNS